MATSPHNTPSSSKRKFLVFCASFAVLYPILKLIGFSVPRKPRIIEVTKPLSLGGFYIGPDFILFDNGKKTWALPRKCTHLGCTIIFHEGKGLLECPCHQSQFSSEGKVIHGPAKKDLAQYKVEKLKDHGGYIVTM